MYSIIFFFFFNDTATTEIYTLSLHDALPIFADLGADRHLPFHKLAGLRFHEDHRLVLADDERAQRDEEVGSVRAEDRKSTRLNSSHLVISYAVFCLKKKKTKQLTLVTRGLLA